MLPTVPMLAFLMLLCGGYFVLFTGRWRPDDRQDGRGHSASSTPAGGDPARVSFRTASCEPWRAWVPCVALGGGFLLAVFNEDRCAFHDGVADTRVVAA